MQKKVNNHMKNERQLCVIRKKNIFQSYGALLSMKHMLVLFFRFPSRKWMRHMRCKTAIPRSKYFRCFSERFMGAVQRSILHLWSGDQTKRGPEQGKRSNIEYWRVEKGKHRIEGNPSEPISHIAKKLAPRPWFQNWPRIDKGLRLLKKIWLR